MQAMYSGPSGAIKVECEEEEDSNNNMGRTGYIGAALVVNTIAYCATFSPSAALNPLITQLYAAPLVGTASQALVGFGVKVAGMPIISSGLGLAGRAISGVNHYAVPLLLGAAVIKCGFDFAKSCKIKKDKGAGKLLLWYCFKKAIYRNSACVANAFIKHETLLTLVGLYLGMAAFSNKN